MLTGQGYSSFQLSVSGEMWGSLVPAPRVLLGWALGVNFTPERPSNDPVLAFPAVPGLLELTGEVLGNPDGAVPIIFLSFLTHSLSPAVRAWFTPAVVVNTTAANCKRKRKSHGMTWETLQGSIFLLLDRSWNPGMGWVGKDLKNSRGRDTFPYARLFQHIQSWENPQFLRAQRNSQPSRRGWG